MNNENHNRELHLIKCFSAVFPSLSRDEITRASQALMPSWDSLATVTLIAVVEDEFGIEIAPHEMENLGSFEMFLNYLADATVTTASELMSAQGRAIRQVQTRGLSEQE